MGNRYIEEIRGPGVVGLKPVIQPEETFKYSSFCPLKTPFGVMHGSFQMKNSDGKIFGIFHPRNIEDMHKNLMKMS